MELKTLVVHQSKKQRHMSTEEEEGEEGERQHSKYLLIFPMKDIKAFLGE
jgi:hypothetical protein